MLLEAEVIHSILARPRTWLKDRLKDVFGRIADGGSHFKPPRAPRPLGWRSSLEHSASRYRLLSTRPVALKVLGLNACQANSQTGFFTQIVNCRYSISRCGCSLVGIVLRKLDTLVTQPSIYYFAQKTVFAYVKALCPHAVGSQARLCSAHYI